jgi:hypothetical protein
MRTVISNAVPPGTEKQDIGGVGLLTRFRLLTVLRETVFGKRSGGCMFFYDSYGIGHGAIFLAICRVIGRQRLEAWISALAAFLHLPLRVLPHGKHISDYANLQMGASIEATHYLRQWSRKEDYAPAIPLPEGALGRDEAMSLHLKYTGIYVWKLIENIRVLKRLTTGPISVYVNHGDWPIELLSRVECEEGVRVVEKGRHNGLANALIALVVILFKGILYSCRLFKRRPGNRRHRYTVATEVIDPDAFAQKPAQPNYLIGDQFTANDVLFYIMPSQKHLFRGSLAAFPENYTIVDLGMLPLDRADLAFLARGYWSILKMALREGRPLLTILTYIGYVDKYVLLTTLFKLFEVGVHVYNSYPQGRVAWRHDSGLVTGACRRQGVHSLSYQTRAHFGWVVEYCFDCYDTYCLWGEWWKTCYQEHLFVKDIEVIGSVFLDAYANLAMSRDYASPAAVKTVVLFTCDIHLEEPSYLTIEYSVQFVSAAIQAVCKLNRMIGHRYYRVVIKPKHIYHNDIFKKNSVLSSLLLDAKEEVEYLARKDHDVEEIIEGADYVLSLLPTTPGIEALLLGKPSAYFTLLRWGDPLFDSENPLIVKSQGEIEQFLLGERPVDNGFLNRLDPYRDGRAKERLCKVIRSCTPCPFV